MELGFVYCRAFVSRFKTEASVLVFLSKPHTHLPIFASLVDYSFTESGFFVVVTLVFFQRNFGLLVTTILSSYTFV
jgi:hypothetical protein